MKSERSPIFSRVLTHVRIKTPKAPPSPHFVLHFVAHLALCLALCLVLCLVVVLLVVVPFRLFSFSAFALRNPDHSGPIRTNPDYEFGNPNLVASRYVSLILVNQAVPFHHSAFYILHLHDLHGRPRHFSAFCFLLSALSMTPA